MRRLIDMDHRLMSQLADFGSRRFHEQGFDPFFLEPEVDDAHDHAHDDACEHDHDHDVMFADLSFPLSLFCQRVDGKTVVEHFLDGKGKYLGAEDKAWLAAQQAAAFSLWQLAGLEGDTRITIRDRLRDTTVTVTDPDLARHGHKGELYLGRVVTFQGEPVLTALAGEVVTKDEADDVVSRVRGKVAVDTLASFETQRALVDAWQDEVFEDDEDVEESPGDAELRAER